MTIPNDNARRLAQHTRLVEALLHDPLALAVPPRERSLLQTAISSLVVAGGEVYKLRKPLTLDFLDFATPTQRRADCEEELRLNRRTAPQVYIDVQPITGTLDAPRIGGDAGAAIDWALRMHRFDDTQRLDRLAERGELTAAPIDALAGVIAQFHGALAPSPPAFGLPETTRHWSLGNFEVLLSGPAASTHGRRLLALQTWTEAEFTRLAPLLAARHATGFVRECHGDLHLGNIVRVDGRPVPFDCLEFNPALRHIDVIADLAFTFMDLQRHGLGDLAWRLVNGYAELTGDYAGLAALRFFAVYRAMVRAKVALLRAEQHDAEAWLSFERDLTLAETIAAPRSGPLHLVLASGVSGSGKSTLAQMLVESLGAVRVRSDVERKRLHGMAPHARPAASQMAQVYAADATARTYARLRELAATLLTAGLHTIVDAALLRREERDALRTLAARQGAQATLLECHAPEPVLRERVRRRLATDDDASDADLAVLDQQLQRREPATDDERPCRIDTDCSLDALRIRALRCIGIA